MRLFESYGTGISKICRLYRDEKEQPDSKETICQLAKQQGRITRKETEAAVDSINL